MFCAVLHNTVVHKHMHTDMNSSVLDFSVLCVLLGPVNSS